MRNAVYVALMASFLAIVVAVASGPVMAADNQQIEHPMGSASMSGTTDQSNTGMQSEMPGHMQGRMPEHMQSNTADQGKAAQSADRKAEFSDQARAGVSRETHTGASLPEAAATAQRGRDVSTAPAERASAAPRASKQAVVGHAVVAKVDRPENCLRIRRGPAMSYDVMGCAADGTTLNLTGVFSNDGLWAQLDNNGWVFVRQIKTDMKPPQSISRRETWQRAAGAGSSATAEGYYEPYYGDYSYYGWPGYYYSPREFAPGPSGLGLPLLPPLPPLPGLGNILP